MKISQDDLVFLLETLRNNVDKGKQGGIVALAEKYHLGHIFEDGEE
jgi:hypothetical protein